MFMMTYVSPPCAEYVLGNIMAADDLATQGARASAAMILI